MRLSPKVMFVNYRERRILAKSRKKLVDDDLRIYGTRNSQQVYSGASCGKGVGHRFVIWLGMRRRSVNQGSGMKVAADVQIRPEEEQGTGREEEVSFRDANKKMIPTKRDGES